jgi:hypothetical protein
MDYGKLKPANTYHHENGQTLVFLVLVLLVLLGMLALVLDGGMAYAQRRALQNAADAGALAGAYYLCGSGDLATKRELARNAAMQYAIDLNGAQTADIDWPQQNEIEVVTSRTSQTFFGWALGQNQITVNAAAAAGCQGIGEGNDITVPFVYPCIPPDPNGQSESEDCEIKYYDETRSLLWNMQNGRMKLILDSDPTSTFCGSVLNCDIDGDGMIDILDGDRRGWVSLDGTQTGGAVNNWIINGFNGAIGIKYWLPAFPGVVASDFQAVREYIEKDPERNIITVPIFHRMCPKGKPNIWCPDPPNIGFESGDTLVCREPCTDDHDHLYYRIIAFARFKVTCVVADGSDKITGGGPPTSRCDFRQYLHETQGFTIDPDPKSIEGYFLPMTDSGDGGGADMGLYVIRLSR